MLFLKKIIDVDFDSFIFCINFGDNSQCSEAFSRFAFKYTRKIIRGISGIYGIIGIIWITRITGIVGITLE